jgi:predicted RNA-binding Zn-ribbon protein involved in translation (DUF1610 family)
MIGGAVLITFIVAWSAWSSFHTPANSVDMPNGSFWVCKKCGNHFAMSERELNEHQAKHYGEPLPCPKCGSTDLVRSIRCEKCGEYYPMGRGGPNLKCPKCGTPATPQAKS